MRIGLLCIRPLTLCVAAPWQMPWLQDAAQFGWEHAVCVAGVGGRACWCARQQARMMAIACTAFQTPVMHSPDVGCCYLLPVGQTAPSLRRQLPPYISANDTLPPLTVVACGALQSRGCGQISRRLTTCIVLRDGAPRACHETRATSSCFQTCSMQHAAIVKIASPYLSGCASGRACVYRIHSLLSSMPLMYYMTT